MNQVVSSPEVDFKSGVREDIFPMCGVLINKADMQFRCPFSSLDICTSVLVALWRKFSTRSTTFLTVRQDEITSVVMRDSSSPVYKVLTNKADMQFMCPFNSLGCMINKGLWIQVRNCLWKGRDLHQHADSLVDRVHHQVHHNPYFQCNNENIGINLRSCVW